MDHTKSTEDRLAKMSWRTITVEELQNYMSLYEELLLVMLNRQQERIGKEREEVERQRKLLSKRKPPVATAAASKQPKATKDGDVFLKPADKPLVVLLVFCHLILMTVQICKTINDV